MTKTKKPHIPQSVFRRLRNWFSKRFTNLRETFCCMSVAVEDDIEEIPQPLPEKSPSTDCQNLEEKTDSVAQSPSKENVTKTPASPHNSPAIGSRKKAKLDLSSFFQDTRKRAKAPSLCPCDGIGEHPITPSRSLTAASPRDGEPTVKASKSALYLLNTKPVSCLPECRLTTLARKHQGCLKGSSVIGTQCTSMAFSAIVANTFFPCGLWTTRTLDRILCLGDTFHEGMLSSLGDKAPASGYLSADDMPEFPGDDAFVWPVRCIRGQEIQGFAYTNPTRLESLLDWWSIEATPGVLPWMNLSQALEITLNTQRSDGCILTMGDFSTSIMNNPAGGYLLFDSHSKDILGLPCQDGAATLLRFESRDSLVSYLSMLVEDGTQFSVTGFKVEKRE